MAEIIKRNKKWQYRVFFKTPDGKQKSKSKSGFRTKYEAEEEAREVEYQIKNQNHNIFKEDITLAEYFENWVNHYKVERFSNSTEHNYLNSVKVVKKYFIGSKLLSEINKYDYQVFIDEYAKGTKKV